jgi:hypothetical protein
MAGRSQLQSVERVGAKSVDQVSQSLPSDDHPAEAPCPWTDHFPPRLKFFSYTTVFPCVLQYY